MSRLLDLILGTRCTICGDRSRLMDAHQRTQHGDLL